MDVLAIAEMGDKKCLKTDPRSSIPDLDKKCDLTAVEFYKKEFFSKCKDKKICQFEVIREQLPEGCTFTDES